MNQMLCMQHRCHDKKHIVVPLSLTFLPIRKLMVKLFTKCGESNRKKLKYLKYNFLLAIMKESQSTKYSIKVLLQNGTFTTFQVSPQTSIADLKDLITNSTEISIPDNHTISLIYLGHVLKNSQTVYQIAKSNLEFTIHCVLKQKRTKKSNKNQLSTNSNHSFQTSTNNSLSDNSFSTNQNGADGDINTNAPESQNDDSGELRGFDRLLIMNYTREQIARIRRQFHQMTNTVGEPAEQQLAHEDEWFPALFNNDEPLNLFGVNNPNRSVNQNDQQRNSLNGLRQGREDEAPLVNDQQRTAIEYEESSVYYFVGFAAGFFFGIGIAIILPLFCREKKFLIGLSFGLSIHYLFALLA
ncbi:hypothetical protein TRFO_31723 [Tritrichomonas foetus]|uniref:Ubiquitin-like domain-containing protein n=1 Tax=Tritrichomonas foetus TaxID=1144522 RepID=A0A1J4JQR1_9EUKA|nr:hypothetical protein TRFO_31723 [Tritrichomonas foetus]|eukprot:OHT01457.1 hypothetical protein TRFO_31723 [Tritrichomonas foetus]